MQIIKNQVYLGFAEVQIRRARQVCRLDEWLWYMDADFIVNTITAWDEPPRARHQFTQAASRKFKVAFVTRNKVGLFRIKMYEGAKNTLVVEPYFPIDYRFRYRLPIINEWYQNWLFRKLKRQFPDASVVNFDCTATEIVKYYPNVIYYCNDEFRGNTKYKSALVDKYLERCERIMARDARFCVTTAHFLTQKLKQLNPHTYEIPLGVSVDGDRITQFAIDKNQPKIRVGIMGVINERQYSFTSINKLINHNRFEVVIIGTVTPEFLAKLDPIDPANLKGMLKGKQLFEELKTLDVGLALYNLDFVNPGGTPNKVWQYFAVGKPTVVSALPNLKYMKFPDQFVYITYSDDDLIEKIEQAYNENSPELMKARVEFAFQNTWDQRFEQFLAVYNDRIAPTGALQKAVPDAKNT